MAPDRDLGTINPRELLKKKGSVIPPNILQYIKSKDEKELLKIITYEEPSGDINRLTAKQKLDTLTNISLKDVILSTAPDKEALAALRLSWILSLNPEVNYDRRKREVDLYRIHLTWPDEIDYLSSVDIAVIDEISQLAQEAFKP